MVIKCQYCNKEYSSYSSRSNHIKKYHSEVNIHNIPKNIHINIQENIHNNIHTCKYCNKKYNKYFVKWRHEKNCATNNQITNKILEENQKLRRELDEIKNNQKLEIEKCKNEILKSLKIHPKTLQKINNQLNNETNNINNGTINNINIIPLGKENLSELLTDKEKINILSTYGNCITELVKLVHVSDKDKYKPYKNIYITNLQNNIAYKYDDKKKKFIAITKNELLETIINNRIGDIEEFYNDYKDKITPFTAKQIDSFLKKIDEKEYKDVKKDDIKLAIYNGREEIINQIKENNPECFAFQFEKHMLFFPELNLFL